MAKKVYSIEEIIEEYGAKFSTIKTTDDFKFNYSIHDLYKMKEDCQKYISDRFGINLNMNVTGVSWELLKSHSADLCSFITDDAGLIKNISKNILKFKNKYFSILSKELKKENYIKKPEHIIQECIAFISQNYHLTPKVKRPRTFDSLGNGYYETTKGKYFDGDAISLHEEIIKVFSIFEKTYITYK